MGEQDCCERRYTKYRPARERSRVSRTRRTPGQESGLDRSEPRMVKRRGVATRWQRIEARPRARSGRRASYCTDTTRSSRDREADVVNTAIFARPCRSNGSRKRSSTTPNIGIAKLKGSKAKNPKASVAGSSQVGRFGCLSACHRSRRSLRLIRHILNILRIVSSLGFAYLGTTARIESRSAGRV
jgi:hypothetical protein